MGGERFKLAMPIALIGLLISLATGCNVRQEKAAAIALTAGNPNFAAAHLVIVNRCVSCHSNFESYSETEWVNNHYLVRGQPAASTFFNKISAANPNVPGDMPYQQPAVSAAEIAVLSAWIVGMAPPTPVSPDGAIAAGRRLQAARTVLTNSCVSCHSVPVHAPMGSGTPYAGTNVPAFDKFATDDAFVNSGLVLPGDPGSSWLYQSLKGYGTYDSMPATALDAADAQILSDWISQMP